MDMTLKKSAADGIYKMEGGSAWIMAGEADIWIVNTQIGIHISVWPKDTEADPIDSIFLNWDKIKGESK